MSHDIDYGNLTKRIVFTENDHRHAQLVLKLKYLRMSQSAFFRYIITGFLEEDPNIIKYIDRVSNRSKSKKAKTANLKKKGQQKLQDLALSDGDVENLFDMIEQDHPDL